MFDYPNFIPIHLDLDKIWIWVLYMSFDKFLLAVESRDLSQADKSIIRVSSFPKLFLNDKIYSYT